MEMLWRCYGDVMEMGWRCDAMYVADDTRLGI